MGFQTNTHFHERHPPHHLVIVDRPHRCPSNAAIVVATSIATINKPSLPSLRTPSSPASPFPQNLASSRVLVWQRTRACLSAHPCARVDVCVGGYVPYQSLAHQLARLGSWPDMEDKSQQAGATRRACRGIFDFSAAPHSVVVVSIALMHQ